MNINKITCFIVLGILCTSINAGKLSDHAPTTMQVGFVQNLSQVHTTTQEKDNTLDLINTLMQMTANPYNNSLPLLASAMLGDKPLYFTTLTTMIRSLYNMDNNPLPEGMSKDAWMQNNAFKAWMWGRVLMAALIIGDDSHVAEAKQKLEFYLNQGSTAKDNPAFFAWARAYLATLSWADYQKQIIQIRIDINNLVATYEKSNAHQDLSNALWECVMAINASATVGDEASYQLIKQRILEITHEKTISNAILKHLSRNKVENDYPAWALSIIELAAARIDDKALYTSLNHALPEAITKAREEKQVGEYTLSKLTHRLATFNAGRATPKIQVR